MSWRRYQNGIVVGERRTAQKLWPPYIALSWSHFRPISGEREWEPDTEEMAVSWSEFRVVLEDRTECMGVNLAAAGSSERDPKNEILAIGFAALRYWEGDARVRGG